LQLCRLCLTTGCLRKCLQLITLCLGNLFGIGLSYRILLDFQNGLFLALIGQFIFG
jgi:hypothetical protein